MQFQQQGAPQILRNDLPRDTEYDCLVGLMTACDSMCGAGMVVGYTGSYCLVDRPDKDSAPNGQVVLLPSAKLASGQMVFAAMSPKRPVQVEFLVEDGVPEVGDSMGTVKDQWYMKKGNAGFVCLGVLSESLPNGRGRAVVRPFSAGAFRYDLMGPLELDLTVGTTQVWSDCLDFPDYVAGYAGGTTAYANSTDPAINASGRFSWRAVCASHYNIGGATGSSSVYPRVTYEQYDVDDNLLETSSFTLYSHACSGTGMSFTSGLNTAAELGWNATTPLDPAAVKWRVGLQPYVYTNGSITGYVEMYVYMLRAG